MGNQRNDAAGPFGVPPVRTVNLINLDVIYGVSNRLSLDLTMPFSTGSSAVIQGTPQSHRVYEWDAAGLGDVSLQAEYWLSNPAIPSRVTGSVGFGFKAPTGRDDVQGTVYSPVTGGDVQAPLDENTQLGTGGWELLFRAQGTVAIKGPLFGYASGYYGLSLAEHTDVINGGTLRGLPDTYSGRLGAAYLLPFLLVGARDGALADEGLVLSLGGRVNGVTVKDLIGSGDLYFRRPGYVIYVEPGLTWTLGPNMASVSVPVRAYVNSQSSLYALSRGRVGAGSFASYLFLASFARRF